MPATAREAILTYLWYFPAGRTARQISDRTGIMQNQVSARLSKLVADGLVITGGNEIAPMRNAPWRVTKGRLIYRLPDLPEVIERARPATMGG